MKRTREQEWSGPRRLPTVDRDGDEYFVDVCLRQFRTVTPPPRHVEFIDFKPGRGRRMLEDYLILECFWCGQTIVVSRRSSEKDVQCMQCGARLSLR